MTSDYISEHDKKHICAICDDLITCRGCIVYRRAEEREAEARATGLKKNMIPGEEASGCTRK